MSETWVRRLLYVCGAWNILGGVTALVDPERHFAQLYRSSLAIDEPLAAFFFRATWINVIAWGVGYTLAGRYPAGRGPVLLAGAVGKLAYFAACTSLFFSGAGNNVLMAAGVADVVFAAFFAYAVWLQRSVQSRAE